MVVFSMSLDAILILLYPEKPSMSEYSEDVTVLSTKVSMCGIEKSSLGLAQFRSL